LRLTKETGISITTAFGRFVIRLLVVGVVALLPALAQAQINVTGQWTTLPYTMPINPIHLGLLHTGKVLVVAGSENEPDKLEDEISKAAVWDPQAGTITVLPNLPWDVFCNGMAFFPDGRALIVGGTESYDHPFTGDARATIFDPITEKFAQVESMTHGRWYATATAMDDGRILTFSGYSETGPMNNAVEIYKIAYGWSPPLLAPWTPPLYPWLHLLPSGKIFYSGPTAESNVLDLATSTWTLNVARTRFNDERPYGSSVLLPLVPEQGYAPRVMIMGGHDPATATAEIIDLSQPAPQWRSLPPMSQPRVEMSAVLLPNGKVMASGGSLINEDVTSASRAADLFDPATETWSSAGMATYARLYHSVALLLPDATVVTAGSNPNRGTYEPHIEVWTPPYLFTTDGAGNAIPAARPTIASAPTGIGYAGSFTVGSPNAADIGSVVLMRAGAPTHSFDMEQRMVGLSFSASGTTLTVAGPPSATIAPPGYYMLFILNRAGVPSVARFVQVLPTSGNQPPRGTITQPATDVTIMPGQAVTFAGSGSDADGSISRFAWIFPEGTPAGSNSPNPGAVTFPTGGTYVASLTVLDSLGENDPSPPTRTIRVTSGDNVPPFANPGSPYSGEVGQLIQFNGAGSYDADGSITGYQWYFGDGGVATGPTPTHRYVNPGTYRVFLTVTDNRGGQGSDHTTATITTAGNEAPTAKPGGPYASLLGQAIQFNGTGSFDPDGPLSSYAWGFGDGSTGTGPTPTHTYAATGTYPVTLTVTDNRGATVSASTTATVRASNQAPVSKPGGPYTGTPGQLIQFNGAGSSDPDGTIQTYQWYFGDGGTGTGPTPTHRYVSTGTYRVFLNVTDNDGASASANTTASITAGNQLPTARPGGPYSGVPGQAIQFNGSASSDPDGSISGYVWAFGDGSVGTGPMPVHAYAGPGTYTVSLTVTDNSGASASASTTATVTLTNQVPVSRPGGPYAGAAGQLIQFNGAGSSDPDGTIQTYQWYFGDGGTGTGPTPTHRYASAGTYRVFLNVIDNGGATGSANTTATVTVGNQVPTANPAGPYSGAPDQGIQFNGSGSSDPDGSISAYAWTFGDGGTGTGPTPTHAYTGGGLYTVTLTVTDNGGATGTASTTASVTAGDQLPTANPGGPYSGTVGQVIQFNGTGSSDPDGSIQNYQWYFGDGATGIGPTPTHAYASPGIYRVFLNVTDSAGNKVSGNTTTTITAPAQLSTAPSGAR
jgi:PKD repeat protein